MGVPATMMTAAPVIEVGLMAAVLKMLMKAAKIEVSLPTTVGATIEVSWPTSVEVTTRRAKMTLRVVSTRSSANRPECMPAIFLEASHSICSEPVNAQSISSESHFVWEN